MSRTKTAVRPGAARVRCAIYTRKSTDEGLDQEFNSLDAQREAGEAFVASQAQEGWTVIATRYDDGGFTGGNLERPALRRLLADVEAGTIDAIIVYKVDRLSRSLLDFARLIDRFEARRVAFVSVTQQFNSANSMGRLVLNVLLSFAQFEREIIGERIRDKIAATKKKGKWAGGFPVLGYDVDRSGPSPRLVPNAAEAARVREIFRLYLDLGSLLSVVEELRRRGWANKENRTSRGEPRGGKPFDKCGLHGLLTNPVYVGRVRHKANVYPGEHEPIVEPAVFDRVQDTLRKNARAGGPLVRNRHGALLRGILFCKGCDRTMVHTFTCKGQKRYRYYTCTAAIKSGRKACPSPSLPSAEAERVVVDQLRGLAADPGLRAEVVRQANVQFDADLAATELERGQLGRELGRHHAEVRTLAASGTADAATAGRLADLHERIARSETRSAELDARIASLRTDRLTPADAKAAFADFDAVWEALAPREQAAVVELLVARVEFDPSASEMAISFHPTAVKKYLEHKPGGAA